MANTKVGQSLRIAFGLFGFGAFAMAASGAQSWISPVTVTIAVGRDVESPVPPWEYDLDRWRFFRTVVQPVCPSEISQEATAASCVVEHVTDRPPSVRIQFKDGTESVPAKGAVRATLEAEAALTTAVITEEKRGIVLAAQDDVEAGSLLWKLQHLPTRRGRDVVLGAGRPSLAPEGNGPFGVDAVATASCKVCWVLQRAGRSRSGLADQITFLSAPTHPEDHRTWLQELRRHLDRGEVQLVRSLSYADIEAVLRADGLPRNEAPWRVQPTAATSVLVAALSPANDEGWEDYASTRSALRALSGDPSWLKRHGLAFAPQPLPRGAQLYLRVPAAGPMLKPTAPPHPPDEGKKVRLLSNDAWRPVVEEIANRLPYSAGSASTPPPTEEAKARHGREYDISIVAIDGATHPGVATFLNDNLEVWYDRDANGCFQLPKLRGSASAPLCLHDAAACEIALLGAGVDAFGRCQRDVLEEEISNALLALEPFIVPLGYPERRELVADDLRGYDPHDPWSISPDIGRDRPADTLGFWLWRIGLLCSGLAALVAGYAAVALREDATRRDRSREWARLTEHDLDKPMTFLDRLERQLRSSQPALADELSWHTSWMRSTVLGLRVAVGELTSATPIRGRCALRDGVLVPLAALMRAAAVRAECTRIDVQLDAPEEAWVDVPPEMMFAIVRNLCHNAFKYRVDDEFALTLRLKVGRRQVRLEVSDEGMGIGAEIAPHLFTEGTRAFSAVNSGIAGRGLGLSVTRSLVELYGGTLSLTTAKDPTTFTIQIPVAPGADHVLGPVD